MLTFGSVCSGIEAASVAWHPLGWETAWLAEIEKAPAAVLAHHYPTTWNMGDMTAIAPLIRAGSIPAPDVLVGGTPCQAFSVAGLRNSLSDARGQLTLSFVDLANAIDEQRDEPCVVVWENVPGVLNTKDNAFGCFLAALAGEDEALVPAGGKWSNAGCVYGPQRAIAWRVLDAQYFGVAQRRRRVFVVASARNGFDPATVLFECESVRRDSPPSRGQGPSATVGTLAGTSPGGGWRIGADEAAAGHLVACSGYLTAYSIQAGALRENPSSGPDGAGVKEELAYTLEARAEVQCIAFSCKDYGADAGSLSPTLRAMGHSGSHANAGGQVAVCVTGDVTHTLKAEGFDGSEDGTGRGQPIVATAVRTANTSSNGWGISEGGPTYTLDASGGGQCLQLGSSVRRLTPTECERLQGFPDGYTLVPYRGKQMADGPRYKMLGNSMAVPCMTWIGRRIDAALRSAHNAP